MRGTIHIQHEEGAMADDQNSRRESGQPGGGVGRREEVGGSGVYPASAGNAPAAGEKRGWAGLGGGQVAGRAGDFLAGLVVGAGLMYVLDPDRGRRRRALVRDQVVSAGHSFEELGETVSAKARHLRNQAAGLAAEAQARLQGDEVDDFILEARVRSEIGRAVSTPGAVHVSARKGQVTLTGPVLAQEVAELLATARSVRGVEDVRNRLEVHERPGSISALQGAAH
ncbi:hypothetical protein BH24GEM2_BH24GEM2_16520 [soil metagenome]